MLRSILMSVFGLVVSLLLVELGVRLLSPATQTAEDSDRPAFYYKAQTASLFRDFPEEFPENSTKRIAVIGDSFTFATSMQFDDAFPDKLERLIALEGYTGVSVINYGVPGYSTSHERDAVVQAVKDGADLIVLQVTLNDPQLKAYRPSGLTGQHQFGPLEIAGTAASVAKFWKTYAFVRTRLHNTQTFNNYIQYYKDLFYNKSTWNPFKGAITDIHQYTEAHGVKLVAVVFPLFGVPLDRTYPFHPIHTRIGNLFKRKNIPVLDLYSTFDGISLDRIQVEPGKDFHPNEYGHRLAAEALYEWLVYERNYFSDLTGEFTKNNNTKRNFF